MWSFEILKVTMTDENTAEVLVKFVNGETVFEKFFYAMNGTFTKTWLDKEIKNEVANQENKATFTDVVKKGAYELTPTPTTTPPTTTVEESAVLDINAKLAEAAKVKKLYEMGIVDKIVYDVAVAAVKSIYDPKYIKDVKV